MTKEEQAVIQAAEAIEEEAIQVATDNKKGADR